MTDEDPPPTEAPKRLTPAMRTVLIVVAVVAAAGIALSVWLVALPSAEPDAVSTPSPSAADVRATPGPVPGATPTTGSEVTDPAPDGGAPGQGGLPPVPTPTPRVAAPLPASANAEGSLVEGYPTAIIGPAADSDVLTSSIATEGGTMQVTLVARTDAPADQVRDEYRARWAALGLAETSGTADSATIFADGYTSLSLAFSSGSGTGTVYMLYGVFRTE